VCVCVYLCVCVRESEREREKERGIDQIEKRRASEPSSVTMRARKRASEIWPEIGKSADVTVDRK